MHNESLHEHEVGGGRWWGRRMWFNGIGGDLGKRKGCYTECSFCYEWGPWKGHMVPLGWWPLRKRGYILCHTVDASQTFSVTCRFIFPIWGQQYHWMFVWLPPWMKTWIPNKSPPHQEIIFNRSSKIILSGFQHPNTWEHKRIQLVEWFVLIGEEEKKRRENIQTRNSIFFKLSNGPQ